jgi:hypothetical protein
MGVGGQHHAPAALPPGKRPGIHCTGGSVGPRAGFGRVRKISPRPGFDPWTFQPVASRYTDYAIPLGWRVNRVNLLISCLQIFFFLISVLGGLGGAAHPSPPLGAPSPMAIMCNQKKWKLAIAAVLHSEPSRPYIFQSEKKLLQNQTNQNISAVHVRVLN